MSAMKPRRPEPAEIEFGRMRFLITECPRDSTLDKFMEELKKHNAHDVVRVCDPTYGTDLLKNEGISVLDWAFDDGKEPPSQIIDDWVGLLQKRFNEEPGCCVAVHCVAGLGRAPVLVALALMEGGMKYEDAVEMIRTKRRGAINAHQLAYLAKYRPKSRLKFKNGHKSNKGCSIQ